MYRIRNARQYQEMLAKVAALEAEVLFLSEYGKMLSRKKMNDLLAMGEALDKFELERA
jgi:hypothetical protein